MMTATSTLTPTDMAAAAIHEAGHAVAVVLSGGSVDFACVRDDVDSPGRTDHRGIPTDRQAEVSYAGPWAEARFRAGRDPGLTQIRAVLNRYGSRDHAEITASGALLPRGIERHLETCWDSIQDLAAKMIGGPIHHDDVCVALGVPEVGASNSLAAAAIRSGSAPGTFTVTLPD